MTWNAVRSAYKNELRLRTIQPVKDLLVLVLIAISTAHHHTMMSAETITPFTDLLGHHRRQAH